MTMPTPVHERPVRVRRFGARFGCVAVLVFLAVLVACVVFAVRQPLPGIALVVVVVAAGVALLRYAARRERADDARELARLRAVAPPTGNAWRVLLEHEGLGRLVERLRERVRPALRVTTRPASSELALGQSRIGGTPDLPADIAWPEHASLPMMFLAQLDLGEIRRSSPDSLLPATGHLWFFYSLAQPWGFDPKDAGASRVLYRPDGASLTRSEPPGGLPEGARFPACAVSFEAYDDVPDIEDADADGSFDDDETDRYIEIRSYLASGGEDASHKLFGFADTIQSSMELECQLVTNGIYCGDSSGYEGPQAKALEAGQSEWRLLLQLDSDEHAEMMWGDAGRLYFWIRETDLRTQRFDASWLILQCH